MSSILPRYSNNTINKFTSQEYFEKHKPNLSFEANESSEDKPTLAIEDNSWSQVKDIPTLDSPHYLLTGHSDEVLTCNFSNEGKLLASGGMDSKVNIWNIGPTPLNILKFSKLRGAITDLVFTLDDDMILSSTSKGRILHLDLEKNQLKSQAKLHSDIANSVKCNKKGSFISISGGNDGYAIIADIRTREVASKINLGLPVLSVELQDDYTHAYTGGLDNTIREWDIRTGKEIWQFLGHNDSITSLKISHEGSFLLSNSMDNSLRVWDTRKSSTKGMLKIYKGLTHGYDKNLIKAGWSKNGRLIGSGSSDKCVHLWDTNTKKELAILGSHEGTVNQVVFSPIEDIVCSCSSDRKVILTKLPQLYQD